MRTNRNCDGCTICCEGWLFGEAHGKSFSPGRPCHFIGHKGCSIYEDRPYDPCKVFKCQWLSNYDIPAWMKPDTIKVLITKREEKGHSYLQLTEVGQRMDPRVLSWFFLEHINGRIINLKYEIDGGWTYIGTPEFVRDIGETG